MTRISAATTVTTPAITDELPVAQSGSSTATNINTAQIVGFAGIGYLSAAPSATDTTIDVKSMPSGVVANAVWAVIDPYTSECEIRKVTGISTLALTVAALTYAHAVDDPVIFVNSPVVNVKWFGARGDGTTEDATAIQRALNQNLSGATNRGTIYYFPQGIYKVSTSLDLTNARDFIIRGDTWQNTIIDGHCSDRAVFDLLGARFFVFEDISINGDDTNSPACAFFGARTATGPNMANFEMRRVNCTNTFAVAPWYFVSVENVHLEGCRSDLLSSPFIYKSLLANDDSVVSDYETISGATAGTIHRLLNCQFGVDGATNNDGIQLEGASGSVIDGNYITIYGTTDAIILSGGQDIVNIRITNNTIEGDGDTFLRIQESGTDVIGLFCANNGLATTVIDMATGTTLVRSELRSLISNAGSGASVMTLEDVTDTEIRNCWNQSTHTYTVNGDFQRNTVYLPSALTAPPSVSGNEANNVYHVQSGTTSRGMILQGSYGIKVGGGAMIDHIYSASTTYDPGTVANGNRVNKSVPITGAVAGDPAFVGVSPALADNVDVFWKTWAGSVRITFVNNTGGNWTPGTLTLNATTFTHP